MSVTEKARDTIARHNMLQYSDRVVVGISGGADSVVLLHFLTGLREELGFDIAAAHLNHRLRGEESDRDERFVRDLCGALRVGLHVESADVAGLAASRGLTLEEAGREARYAFFRELARGQDAKIATAHTLSDSVETALLNLTRGTALRGLCGIPPVRGNIIRPLISCERREIEEYCRDNGLHFVTDSSNLSDDFARNRLRNHVLPVFASINPGFLGTAAAALESLKADADYLDDAAARFLTSMDFGNGTYRREGYLGQGRPIRFRVLLRLLLQNGVYADHRRLARLDAIIAAGSGAEQLADGLYLKACGKVFCIGGIREAQEHFCVRADIPCPSGTQVTDVFPDKNLRLMNTDYEYYEESIKYDKKLLKNALDCDRIDGIINCRQKIPGDAIRLNGRGCTKTLKKLFQEAGISPGERSKIFVLADPDGPVWVEGFGAAERAAVTDNTRRVLILDVVIGGCGNEG